MALKSKNIEALSNAECNLNGALQNLLEKAVQLGWSRQEQEQLKSVYSAALVFDTATARGVSKDRKMRAEKI